MTVFRGRPLNAVWVPAFIAAQGLSLALGLTVSPAQAEPMQTVMLHALEVDPSMAEAQAEVASAEAETESARRQHWPRIGVASAEPFNNRAQDLQLEDELQAYASINVWSGGGINAAVRTSKSTERYYGSKLAQNREDVVYSVASLYLQGLADEEDLALARTNLLRHNSLMHDLGVVANLDSGRRSDLTQAESRQAQARARVVASETALEVVRSRLLRYTSGIPISFEQVSIGGDLLKQPEQEVISRQPEYLEQVAQVDHAQHQLEATRAKRWPKLDFETSYGSTSHALNRLTLNWDLVNPSTFADVDAARQQVVAAQAELAKVEFDLRERLDTARVSYEQAGRKLGVTEEQVVSAQQVVGAFEEQFQIARRSMLDLLNAYAELATVESSVASARAEYRSLALQYLRACGETEAWARQTAGDAVADAAPH